MKGSVKLLWSVIIAAHLTLLIKVIIPNFNKIVNWFNYFFSLSALDITGGLFFISLFIYIIAPIIGCMNENVGLVIAAFAPLSIVIIVFVVVYQIIESLIKDVIIPYADKYL